MTLLAASDKLHDVIGAALAPFLEPWRDECVKRAADALDGQGIEQARHIGQTLTLEAAVKEALREIDKAAAESA